MNRCFSLVALATGILLVGIHPVSAVETEWRYLSGHGPKDAVPWEFSVTKGRRAGEWTTIPVPSNWEQHGFGSYNYGDSPEGKGDEHGLYRLRFTVSDAWKDRRIHLVFLEAVPERSIEQVSVNATADGVFKANIDFGNLRETRRAR